MTVKVTFRCYQGFVKKDGRWSEVGEFPSISAAKEAGATKFRPRYNRSGR